MCDLSTAIRSRSLLVLIGACSFGASGTAELKRPKTYPLMWLLWMLLVAFLSSGAVQGGAKQRNPYTVLELKKEATHAEVKKAYRKAALKYHPDRPCPEPTKEECTSKFIEV